MVGEEEELLEARCDVEHTTPAQLTKVMERHVPENLRRVADGLEGGTDLMNGQVASCAPILNAVKDDSADKIIRQ